MYYVLSYRNMEKFHFDNDTYYFVEFNTKSERRECPHYLIIENKMYEMISAYDVVENEFKRNDSSIALYKEMLHTLEVAEVDTFRHALHFVVRDELDITNKYREEWIKREKLMNKKKKEDKNDKEGDQWLILNSK